MSTWLLYKHTDTQTTFTVYGAAILMHCRRYVIPVWHGLNSSAMRAASNERREFLQYARRA